MGKWARRLAGTALGLAAFAAAAGAVFLARPGLLLTSRTAGAAVMLLGAPYAPRWSSFEFSAEASGLRRHRYGLKAADACAGSGAFKACFKRLELSAVVRWTRTGPRLESLEELTAEGGAVSADLRGLAAGPVSGPPLSLLTTPVRSLRVRVDELDVRAAEGPGAIKGAVSAALTPGARRPVSVEADVIARSSAGARRVKAAFSADTDLFKGVAPTFVDARWRADAAGLGSARADLRARRAGERFDLSGGAELSASTGPLRGLRLSACRGAGGAGSGEASCRFALVPARPPGGRFAELKDASGAARLTARVKDGRLSAVFAADLDPVASWYELAGGLEARLEGALGRPFSEMTLRHEARARAKASFEKLVAFLRDTKHAVPAPFHVLAGPVELVLESRGDPRESRQSLRYLLTTGLFGTRQRLSARADGVVVVDGIGGRSLSLDHSGGVLLKEAALELPRLEAGPAPAVAVDRRIRSSGAAPAPAAPAAGSTARPLLIRSRLSVRAEKPLVLFSNLAKDPVPVALDLVATYPPAAVRGAVGIRSFDVELFRRRATVDHLNVAVSSGSRVASLEGLVLYKTPVVAINIAILGTTERPRVELTSVPPLKREDIIALLVFGKNPDELDHEQTASVSNTQMALESRAFGLASLFLFGSTPIERVGYDSATKTATVKLLLPGGAQLTLGSDFDRSRQLSVRKSLAPHWAIQSEITEQGQQSRAAATFLEWFNRY